MKSFMKKFMVIIAVSMATQAFAQVKEYHPVLTAEEAQEDASLLSREHLQQEIRLIQAGFDGLRAEALLQDDMDTLQEITFQIHYGDNALRFEDVRLMKKERNRLQKALDDMRVYLQSQSAK